MSRILLLVMWIAGCTLDAGEPAGAATAALRYSATGTSTRASTFNRPRQGHNTQCVNVRRWPVPLRYPDFSETGFVLRPEDAVFGMGRALPIDDSSGAPCRTGQIRLDVREIIQTPSGRLLFHQGGYGYAGLGDVKYGHVWIADLADAPRPEPSPEGNGATCAPSRRRGTRGKYYVRVRPIPSEMRYRKSNYAECRGQPDVSACSISFRSYGDPYVQGDPARDPGTTHYTYMVWSFINVPTGGVVRALVPDGAVFERCNVRSIRTGSIDTAGRRNGWVRAVYGRVRFGDNHLYGWLPHSHMDPAGNYVAHLEPVRSVRRRVIGDPAPTVGMTACGGAASCTDDLGRDVCAGEVGLLGCADGTMRCTCGADGHFGECGACIAR